MLNNASAATVQAPPYTSERQRTLATLVVSIALVLEIIDVSIINVAIPVVQRDLLASPRQIEWVVTGYLFFFSILLLTGGRLGDLYGYRRMFISGLLAFGAASAGCGLATSPEMLVAMRIVQGASGAMMGPQILSLMQVLYRPHERFRVMSIFGLLGGAAGILGPVLGGIIIESNLFGLSWRPIFLINVPVIAIAVALAWRVLPAVRSPEAKGIDPLGTLLAVVGGGALLLVPAKLPQRGCQLGIIPLQCFARRKKTVVEVRVCRVEPQHAPPVDGKFLHTGVNVQFHWILLSIKPSPAGEGGAAAPDEGRPCPAAPCRFYASVNFLAVGSKLPFVLTPV